MQTCTSCEREFVRCVCSLPSPELTELAARLVERDQHLVRERQKLEAREAAKAAETERVDFRALVAEFEASAPSNKQLKSEDEMAFELRLERLHDSGIVGVITPEDLEQIARDALPQQTHALRSVKRWQHVRKQGHRAFTVLVLLGETGRGKTVAGGWLLAELGGLYVTAEDLVVARGSFRPKDRELIEKAVGVRVLHIDELFTESDPVRAAGALFEIINRRAGRQGAWTIVTGNRPRDEFAERYGERTMRRMEHQGAIVEVTGDDLRRRGGA